MDKKELLIISATILCIIGGCIVASSVIVTMGNWGNAAEVTLQQAQHADSAFERTYYLEATIDIFEEHNTEIPSSLSESLEQSIALENVESTHDYDEGMFYLERGIETVRGELPGDDRWGLFFCGVLVLLVGLAVMFIGFDM